MQYRTKYLWYKSITTAIFPRRFCKKDLRNYRVISLFSGPYKNCRMSPYESYSWAQKQQYDWDKVQHGSSPTWLPSTVKWLAQWTRGDWPLLNLVFHFEFIESFVIRDSHRILVGSLGISYAALYHWMVFIDINSNLFVYTIASKNT